MDRDAFTELFTETERRARQTTPRRCNGAAVTAAAVGVELQARVDGQGIVWAVNQSGASITAGDRVAWEWQPPSGSVIVAKW